MSKTIVFFGNERIATGVTTHVPTLRGLIEAGYEVKAVVSNFEQGQSRKSRHLEIEEVCREHNIPLILSEKPMDILERLQDYNAAAGVLIAYGKIVPQKLIDIFPRGIINIHPSLLPLHRGPTPLESVILDGSAKTGVSVMKLVRAMDAGPIYAQSEVELVGNETKQELADTLLSVGLSMLLEVLPGILDGSIIALPQDEESATYDSLISKDHGAIDWNKPAANLEREIRAYAEWPRSRTTLANKDVIVTKAHATASSLPQSQPADIATVDGDIAIATSDGILHIERLQPAGKSEMTAQAFLAGHKHLL
ncbi:MAG TPA: methionyl-tRNA formyltransferase [Verrucomicrobiae bacterium]|nr:methionyl-tRNA formyltransferase [Verrucomicrobiae bacterium]